MSRNDNRRMLKLREFTKKNYKAITLIGIVIILPLVYLLVYYTGGIKYVFSHTMYLPILLAGIILGAEYGVLTAIVAGILLGPLMPLDTVANESQLFFNWFYRMIIFVSLGFISGYASSKLRKNNVRIYELMSFNQETMIPNTNYLSRYKAILNLKQHTIVTILISNHHNIIDVLGTDIYYRFLHEIYLDLKKNLESDSIVVQSDSNKFWVVKTYNDLKRDSELIFNIINRPREIDNIPLYADYAIGASRVSEYYESGNFSSFKASDASARYAQINNLPYIVYDNNLAQTRKEYELLATFAKALDLGQTFLVYQPKIDLKTMRPVGIEALIRWQNPDKGLIMPDIFIPLVEQTKMIHLLTDWVLKKALAKIWEFEKVGLTIEISINVSVRNLYDPTFYDRTMKIIEEANVAKHLVQLEITESVLMISPEESKAMLHKFVESGIRIAIDDFGKGYSSLAFLSQFPIEIIKIDRFFLRHIATNVSSQQIVKATIQLAKKLGYKVIAEGVEDETVMKILQEYGCDMAQGYLFARPMNDDAIIKWYKENQHKIH